MRVFRPLKVACSISKLNPPSFGFAPTTDVDDIKFVINFDYPNCSEDYVHRIGRTARSNKSGTAYTFFTTSNAKQANDLISVLQEANQVINPRLYDVADMARGGGGRMRNRGRSGFQGRSDTRGGRRDDSRGGRSQGRDNFGRDRMRNDDRSRPSSRPERSGPSDRGGYNRESQGSYNRDGQNSSYARNGQTAGYSRENPNSGYNRDTYNANRDSQSSGYNRDNQSASKGGLLNTPPASGMYQQERGPPDNRYNLRAHPNTAPPRPPPRPEGNPPPHGNPYMNGQSRGPQHPQMNEDRHATRSNPQMNSHNEPPPQRYQSHNMQMNGSARPTPQAMTNAQTMQSLFQPPPPPPPIPNGSTNKGSLMGPPPQINKYY